MLFFLLFFSKPIPQTIQVEYNSKGTLIESQYYPWNNDFSINNLFDDNDNNCIHSTNSANDIITDSKPFIILVDMGQIINANKFTIYNSLSFDSRYTYQPKNFVLYGGIDKDNLEVMADVTDAQLLDSNSVAYFNTKSFRYYKLVVTKTYCTRTENYISYKYAKFSLAYNVSTYPGPSYPNSNQTYVDKVFNGTAGTDQIQLGENNIKQISGCQFTNIHDTSRNYYIHIVGDTAVYNNIFENTELIDSPAKAGIFWNSYAGQVTITNCKFLRISGKGGEGYVFTSNGQTKVQLTMEKCDFIDCGINNGNLQLISLLHAQSTLRLLECKFLFSSPTRKCGVLQARNNDCVFDHCEFVGCNERTIQIAKGAGANEQTQGTFQFTNNKVLNNHGLFIWTERMITKPIINNNVFEFTTINGNYFINLPTNQELIELNNNTFKQITSTGTTDKGVGAIGVFLESSNSEFTLKYNNCKFYENTNNLNSYPYRCGGALQYGFSDTSNLNCHVQIIKCEFRSNKASQHGGAVAIRTAKSVLIQNCKFETNIANNAKSNSELLFENHYDMKTNGFGGAIYLNPTFNLNGNDYQMSNIEISGCEFTNNQAYQANAIYIEGENGDTTISITDNKFNGNPNNGCLVCSELTTINRDIIANNNEFTNNGGEIFYFVDPAGAKTVPKPTNFPGTADTYINKVINNPEGIDQIQVGVNNVKQISGCRFTNIHKTTRNYYIKINSETIIFDNIFENTQMLTEPKAGIFWNSCSGSITISNCTFIRINGKGGEGYVITSDKISHAHFTMDRCEFIDCGQNNGELQLISVLSKESSIKLLECKFTFTSTTHKCGVLEIRTNDVIFDHCEFTNCNENTILLANKAEANEQPRGTFQFTNNKVKTNQGIFIKTVRMVTKPIIDNNVFESTTVNDKYFINLPTNQELIELNNNTFKQITSTGTTDKGVGGTGIFLESTNSEFTIKYNNCKFLDNTNNLNSYPNCVGGAIQYGFSDTSNLNCHIQIINCEFKNNKAKQHGGAVAIRTAKSVLIQDCKFETNVANNVNNGNSQLLNSNNGFGGGVYLCPVFTVNNNKLQASTINVNGCEFKDNQAYQGFAVYIEGEECDTSFVITKNVFDSNSNTADSTSEGSAICSEIQTVSRRTILAMNTFVGHNDPENTLPSFNFVDQKGDPIPDSEQPPDIIIYNIHNSTSDGRFDTEEDTKQTVLIQIDISNFTGISNNKGDGGAIRIINAGVECNKTVFKECSSENAGGAIFLSNSYDYMNSMILEELVFISNSAKYGGGLYVYSISPINLVSVKHCTFNGNRATALETEKKYGGSAAFITARNSTIMNNHFSNIQGNGGALRIYNKFFKNTQSADSIKSKNQGYIVISNCNFEIGKDANSCLFYDHGNDDPSIDLVHCEFTGNLKPGSHFIDGKSSSKGKSNSQKLYIKGCKFNSNINEAINLDQNKKFIKIDLNDQIFTLEKGLKKKFDNWRLLLFVAIPAAFALVVLLIVFIVKKNQNQVDQQETNENENILI